jgi:shikimate dehydrogenase
MCGNFLEFNNRPISGRSAVYGLIGDPVDHSLSPVIQNAAFRSSAIDAVYVPFEVERSALRSSIHGLRALGVRGFNVTSPHKLNIVRYLDKLESSATEIGSVNTVVIANGAFSGYNTDGLGAMNALKEAGVSPEGKSILILGAGGASRAIGYTLAPRASSIRLLNRTPSRAKQLASRMHRRFGVDVEYAPLVSKLLRSFVERADVLVNASSMGTDGRFDPPIKAEWLRAEQCVFDIVYRPFQTNLLKLASQAGTTTVTGLDMLVNQGACSFELWTGRKAPIIEMRHAIAQAMLAMEHAQSS